MVNSIALGAGVVSILFSVVVLSFMRKIVEGEVTDGDEIVRLTESQADQKSGNVALKSVGFLAAAVTGLFGGSVQSPRIFLEKAGLLENMGDFNQIG